MKIPFFFVLLFLPFHLGAEEITLAAGGKSTYIIHLAPEAAPTRLLAAMELRRVLERSTAARLEIDSSVPEGTPAIRLAEDASLPQDGFEIRQEGADIVIAGNDSGPAGTWGLASHGTLWGALEFLERFAGVRWLFPGELGEDVPRHETLRLEIKEPIRGAPGFSSRALAYLSADDRDVDAATLDWMNHLRLTNGLHPHATGYGHSWDDYLKPADMEAHPEWKSTQGEAVRNGKVKFFCTTAPGLVELFTQRVIETLDRYPTREMASISPTDGGGFCTCERCAKLIDPDPHGKPNHARAILTFYQQVGDIIARERPGRRLGGFVYYNYQYPPANAPRLPDNVSLCWAPLNYYGYGLLKPVYRAEFESIVKGWSAITPHFYYHNYSTWMRCYHGAPLPVSLEILQLELPTVGAQKAWGARMVGTSAWGVNSPVNYLIAKQLWNPNLNVSAKLNEWLERAYGPGGKPMRKLYDELDARMKAHKEAQSPIYKGSQYEVNEDVMTAIYAPFFPAMEAHYRAALEACATDIQRQRLRMFGDNLTQLHFALRKAKLVPDEAKSEFYRDDAAFAQFLKDQESSLSLFRDKTGIDHGPIWKGEYSGP